MEPNQVEQLLDMSAVHAFYIGLLEDVLTHPVPIPHDVSPAGTAVAHSVENLQRWLNLLDLAITPPMVRDALKESTTQETAEALLRHFVRKASKVDADRDKTDFVTTFLYRALIPAEKQIPAEFDVEAPSQFEEELYEILGLDEAVSLAEEHRQLVREFPFIHEEVDEFRHFDKLMDSGVIQRVRELKQRFAGSFYHPRVLATIAAYNVFFGHRFDELFKQTAQQIKQFASNVQQQGGSIMSRVDGDVTVKHLTEVEEKEILSTEYGRAQEHFRRISKFKKAVDTRTGGRPQAVPQAPPAHAPSAPMRAAAAPAPARISQTPVMGDPAPAGINPALEQGKLRTMEDSIRNFVLAADPKSANVVPLRNGNLALSNAEVDAFRSEYSGEKSFRADYAIALRQIVSSVGRIQAELQEYTAKQSSAYLWKPHADALTFLISSAQKLEEQSEAVLATAEQRGLADKASSLNGSLQKLRQQVQLAAKALQGNGN
ncbi:MAG: hypothetical protein ACR2IF_19280 [Terriglobales bacterium]